MNLSNPYLQQIDNGLDLISQANAQKLLDVEIADLTQVNRLQLSLSQRLVGIKDLINCRLVSGEELIGRLVKVGLDAIILRTSLTLELINLDAVIALKDMPKSKFPFPVTNPILIASLLNQIGEVILVNTKDGFTNQGKLINVWQDSIDSIIADEIWSFKLINIVKITLSEY